MFFVLLCVLAVLQALDFAHAQTVPAGTEPGRIQQRFEEPPAPQSQVRIAAGLESTMPAAEAAQIQLLLLDVEIEGSTVYSDVELAVSYAGLVGRNVTLLQVFEVAAGITGRYGKDGYLLSRVIVPPQELNQDGAVIRLQAIEGYVDEVIWPEGVGQYRNFFGEYSAKIVAQRPARADRLERYLLLANDLPGLTFKSTLRASEINPGASTLVLEMESDPYDVSVGADNYGDEASGPYEGLISGNLYNAFGAHERLTGGYIIAGPSEADDPELHYFFFGYDQVLNSEGLRFWFTGNASNGDPGTAMLSALGYETNGLNLTTGVSYPFIRTRSQNLTGGIFFDYQDSEGLTSGGLNTEDRLRVVRGELTYDFADQWSGINQAIVGFSQGINGLGSTSNSNPNASRIPGDVDFFKTTLFLSRQQPLPNRFSSYLGLFGQWAGDPLLSAQECGYGGRLFGRGFDPSIITGDHCLLLNGELRYDLQVPASMNAVLDNAQA